MPLALFLVHSARLALHLQCRVPPHLPPVHLATQAHLPPFLAPFFALPTAPWEPKE